MPSRTHHLPEHFDATSFQRIASLRTADPEVFAKLNRHGPVSGPAFYKKFGSGSNVACLIQRNSPVLMVAHVDTVLAPSAEVRLDGRKLYHNALDNRLGVYLGLEVLPAMGLPVDLLLTTGEEEGMSSAALMNTRKQYRWIFSFDRKGEDVVLYQYTSGPLLDILQGAGFAVGDGSYSCIAELEHLGASGINFGCGMADYHSQDAYCDLSALARQLKRFEAFYQQNSAFYFPHPLPEGARSRAGLHEWVVPFESLLWQLEFHRHRKADKAAEECQRRLAFLLSVAPELRTEFSAELASLPELAPDRAAPRRKPKTRPAS